MPHTNNHRHETPTGCQGSSSSPSSASVQNTRKVKVAWNIRNIRRIRSPCQANIPTVTKRTNTCKVRDAKSAVVIAKVCIGSMSLQGKKWHSRFGISAKQSPRQSNIPAVTKRNKNCNVRSPQYSEYLKRL